ncbi:expressed unknown protein [Seminavis robusta]|uniref:Uncharacterized protein n=1 Tax=Seminavis robusta TaxID=568900 RepID=A0A9N8H7R8_9STRA|nr:expressed unknown protein [Seminavis robusta]|eukprot:Sro137_g064420.1 n/a (329) ;mRNA; r:67888-68874
MIPHHQAPRPLRVMESAVISILLLLPISALGFSVPNNNNEPSSSFSLFDRFRPECPAVPNSIRQFDPSLPLPTEDDAIWVAVFRSSNNAPSVFVKDEFLNAMRLATGGVTETLSSSESTDGSSVKNDGDDSNKLQVTQPQQSSSSSGPTTPVAVARLCPSQDFPGTWTLDHMRCSLKKETTDDACEGGSEHKEALSVAMDSLLLHYLNKPDFFWEGAIRTKATLVGASLLEERGFQPVTTLAKDMATHVSSLDASMEKYAEKYVETMSSTSKNQGARDRANEILSLLGRLDREADLRAAQERQQQASSSTDGDSDEDYDPWASVKQYL